MSLYYVRHGQTDWNKARVIQGRVDIRLNDEGIRQAHKMAEILKDIKIDRIYCSPLTRAKQTANIIAEAKGLTPEIDYRIVEMYYGAYESASLDDEAYLTRRATFFSRLPQGESYLDVAARTYSFLSELEKNHHDEDILVVAHGGMFRVVKTYFENLGNEEFLHTTINNCEVVKFEWPDRNYEKLLNQEIAR